MHYQVRPSFLYTHLLFHAHGDLCLLAPRFCHKHSVKQGRKSKYGCLSYPRRSLTLANRVDKVTIPDTSLLIQTNILMVEPSDDIPSSCFDFTFYWKQTNNIDRFRKPSSSSPHSVQVSGASSPRLELPVQHVDALRMSPELCLWFFTPAPLGRCSSHNTSQRQTSSMVATRRWRREHIDSWGVFSVTMFT